ncbi:MAG: ATP-binding SpoIIE family protein phosphatase [Terriglobales bacterium]
MLIELADPSQAGEARREAVAYAQDLRMGEEVCGEIALATTEIATNVIKHAGKGHILLQRIGSNGDRGLRVMGVDKGPGIADISRAFDNGHSTAGSLGQGLGVIRRISNSFDMYSTPGSGTIISAEFLAAKPERHTKKAIFEIGVVSEPIAGETDCGDGWGTRAFPDGMAFMVVDGLGHGVLASEAAREAEKVMTHTHHTAPSKIVEDIHDALKKTRGAAGAIARIDLRAHLLHFSGIGNVSASVVSPGLSRGLASHNGTLGHHIQRIQEFTVPWNENSVLVMHSDGLATRWDLEKYPGILNKHASVIAAILHRDFSRGRDDVTVLVAKATRG